MWYLWIGAAVGMSAAVVVAGKSGDGAGAMAALIAGMLFWAPPHHRRDHRDGEHRSLTP